MLKYFNDISSYFLSPQLITFYIDGRPITFDTSNHHECQYVLKLLLKIRIPQADIDTKLFNKFVNIGDRALDAGANIGFTSIELIKAGSSFVLAVEPVPELFTRLSSNCSGWNISTSSFAISSSTSLVDIVISQTHNQGSTINNEMIDIFPQVFGKNHQRSQVATTTIDQLINKYGVFDIWKLDVEGAEIEALKGAEKSLNESPPRIIIAEIYDIFLRDFINIVLPTHPYCVRAFIRKDNYNLELTDIDNFDESEYELTSPMYVFTKEAHESLRVIL